MNSKRQTIWLVSMLSLMVVLSAYYLFTEDVDKLKNTADPAQTEQVSVNHDQTDAAAANTGKAAADQTVADPTAQDQAAQDQAAADQAPADQSTADQAAGGDLPANAQQHSDAATGTAADKAKQTNEEILNKVANQGSSEEDYFVFNQMTQEDQLSQKLVKLQDIMTDSTKGYEAQAKANEEYDMLEKQQAKMTSIVEQLQKDGYSNAIVQQDSGKWKIIVQSSKLEKSQAVSIVDLVTEVLNVGPDKVAIQYHK
ncbi:SpoIIIAH-like family protein [Gorillibacterium timonense]|uniref:SpoIIIAH-like family protein n=1 Tax=Gorillibacterium timonense TaxID=1689269 RepID=UPI00071C3377|nr:SpoIIIAH-like family protein [Gorillibacterium timonense]